MNSSEEIEISRPWIRACNKIIGILVSVWGTLLFLLAASFLMYIYVNEHRLVFRCAGNLTFINTTHVNHDNKYYYYKGLMFNRPSDDELFEWLDERALLEDYLEWREWEQELILNGYENDDEPMYVNDEYEEKPVQNEWQMYDESLGKFILYKTENLYDDVMSP